MLRVWINRADDNGLHSGSNDCVGAGIGSSGGGAGLERYVKNRASRNMVAKLAEAFDLSVRFAGGAMVSARNDSALVYQHGADGRVWAGFSDSLACLSQRGSHKLFARFICAHEKTNTASHATGNPFERRAYEPEIPVLKWQTRADIS